MGDNLNSLATGRHHQDVPKVVDMTPEEKAAIINARAATALIRAMGMQAENIMRQHRGHTIAYAENAFIKVIEEEGIHWNAIHPVLYD